MKIQFTEEDSMQNSYLGEGQHEVSITSVEQGQSKTGKPMMTVEFTGPGLKTCKDWFVLEFKRKLYSLALASGATPELLKSGEWSTESLHGKKLLLIRSVKGKRAYTNRDGETKEVDDFENSYAPLTSVQMKFTEDSIPF